ncbi:glycosyltransferase family 2 protein [Cohnella boryungensis]|uniref:Glycosyltransferase family 2 protein n=1 Tax=Cohnella boryungensis TaxID=768479 RepID=A0ABV8S5E1_9BACL
MTILIPSYEPDEKLLLLIERLQAAGNRSIVLVDDGSGERYSGIFNQARRAGCTVLTHRSNQGKGSALKTGFRHIRASGDTSGIVCADSDGQHLPKDIAAVGEALRRNPGHIVLGSRHFVGKVPFRSRLGNAATRLVYRFATGVSVRDTQTGLRGYSPDMLDWLCSLSGERFEYEMIMLLEAKQAGYPLIELPIETVYLNGNES